MTLTNDKFVIERVINVPRPRVFATYTTIESKSAWFRTPIEVETLDRELDFRIGGRERFRARWPSGFVSDFQAVYHDIVPDQRIILVYDLFHNSEKLSVSLQTIELIAEGDATRLIHTEQGAYFTGGPQAVAGRAHGTT